MWEFYPAQGFRRKGGFGIQILIVFMLCTGALRAQNCAPAPLGLVGWWKGDGGTTDALGTNHGTLTGNATFGLGLVGQAFSFDGDNDSVMIGNPAALQLQNFSIEAWIKRTSTNQISLDPGYTVGHIFGYGYGGYVLAQSDDGRLTLGHVGFSGVYSTNFIRDTNWHHVAVSKASGTVTFYVDGVGDPALQYDPAFYFTSSAQIGASQWDGTRPTGSFLGSIDEVSVYNRALSASEVASIYVAAGYGKCPLPQPIFVSIGPASGFYTNAVSVTLDATSTNATVRYTLDGTVPSTNSPLYTGPFALTHTTTVSARAFTNGILASETAVSTFRFWGVSSGCVAPAGAISWWTGDGDARDVLGLNPGTPVGNATFEPGRIGQAFSFDGDHDAIVIGNPPSLRLQTFTIETWLRRASTNQVSAQSALFGEILGYGAGGYVFGLRSDGRLFLSRNGVSDVNSTKTVTDTQWHHVAVTKSGSTVVFYVDGVWDSPVTYTDVFTFSSNLEIGAVNDTFDASFLGLIDELAIYARPLDTNEIQALFSAGASGKCPTFAAIIITPPQNRTVPVGANTSFSVTAGGSPILSYQWSFNGAPIPDATNEVLAVTKVKATNAGTYTVTVSNGFAPPATASATLTVSVPPTITQQPKSQTVLVGSAATFTVGYTGTPPLAFQWRRNGILISGGSSPTLVINNVQSGNAGTYTVRISNALGAANSAPATLTVASGQFSALTPTANGIQLNVQGETGGNYILETSSDLKQWDPLATLLNNPPNWQFTDTSASGVSQRFYRLKKSP